MKINQEQALGGLDKALSASAVNDYEMETLDPGLVERTESHPRLLTALFGGEANEVFLETNTFKYEDIQETIQLPGGKTFEAFGNDVQKDKARMLTYGVGSYGLRYNVAPKDYANKRRPGSTELMDEDYVIAQMIKKTRKAWELHDELAYATLLTSDNNYVAGGPMPTYDYHKDVYGSTRGAATDMDLGGTGDHFTAFADQYDIFMEEADKAGSSVSMPVILCGKTFFAKRLEIEQQEGLAREVRGQLDLASMEVPRSNFGSGSGNFAYQWFDSHDGFRYIRYSASILGTKLIGDTDAYMVPVGSEMLMKRIYAPAQDRENVNTTAQRMYSWTRVSNRSGVHVAQESNNIIVSVHPKLIRKLTTTT